MIDAGRRAEYGHWWVHVRFCSVRCEAIYEVKRNDAAKQRCTRWPRDLAVTVVSMSGRDDFRALSLASISLAFAGSEKRRSTSIMLSSATVFRAPDGPGCPVPHVSSLSTRAAQGCGVGRSSQWLSARQPCVYQVAAPNGSIDQTRKRNRKAVRDDRWNAVPISNYRRLDE